jgi:Protein of unknown function (DUF664)
MMTVNDSDTDVRRELLEYLEYQRASVRSIVDGLNEDAWHTPVVAPGWTVAGVVEHLGGAERHWFQEVVAGLQEDHPWDEGRPPYDPARAFTCDRPLPEVLGYYGAQCDRSDQILAGVSLSDVPRGRHGDNEIPNVRVVVLDPPARDREGHDRNRLAVAGDDGAGRSVDENRVDRDGGLGEHRRAPGDLGRPA